MNQLHNSRLSLEDVSDQRYETNLNFIFLSVIVFSAVK